MRYILATLRERWAALPKAVRAWVHGGIMTLITMIAALILLTRMGMQLERLPPVIYGIVLGLMFMFYSGQMWNEVPDATPGRKKREE